MHKIKTLPTPAPRETKKKRGGGVTKWNRIAAQTENISKKSEANPVQCLGLKRLGDRMRDGVKRPALSNMH
jgi:hypothetical protein